MDPEAYRDLAGQLESHRKGARSVRATRHGGAGVRRSPKPGIKAELSGRPKHIYSIYQKMRRKGAELGEIYDVHALRGARGRCA